MFFKKKSTNTRPTLNTNGCHVLSKSLLWSSVYKINNESVCNGLGDRFRNRDVDVRLRAVVELRIFALATHMILLRQKKYCIESISADMVEKLMFDEVGDVGLVTSGDRMEFNDSDENLQASLSRYSDWAIVRKHIATRYWEYSELLAEPLAKNQSDVMGLVIQQSCKHCGEQVFLDIPGLDFILYASGMFVEFIGQFEHSLVDSITFQKPL